MYRLESYTKNGVTKKEYVKATAVPRGIRIKKRRLKNKMAKRSRQANRKRGN